MNDTPSKIWKQEEEEGPPVMQDRYVKDAIKQGQRQHASAASNEEVLGLLSMRRTHNWSKDNKEEMPRLITTRQRCKGQ